MRLSTTSLSSTMGVTSPAALFALALVSFASCAVAFAAQTTAMPSSPAVGLLPASVEPPCICVPETKDGDHYSEWVAWYLRDCIYTPTEHWAFYLGLSTIAIWSIAQIPQFYESYKLKTVDGVSSGLLIQWLTGDITNLLGCVFTGQLRTQLFTAMYFCASDVLLVSQYSYYRFFYESKETTLTTTIEPHRTLTGDVPDEEEVAIRRPAPLTSTNDETRPLLSPTSQSTGGGCRNQRASPFVRVLVAGTICTLTAALVALMAWYLNQSDVDDDDRSRIVVCDAPRPLTPAQEVVGTLAAWGSAMLYFFSRIPQLVQNYVRKSVYGLSVMMFVLAITANVTYGAGILLRFPAIDAHFWRTTLPYLIGSVGTLVFDFAIVTQAWVYGCVPPVEKEEDLVDDLTA